MSISGLLGGSVRGVGRVNPVVVPAYVMRREDGRLLDDALVFRRDSRAGRLWRSETRDHAGAGVVEWVEVDGSWVIVGASA